MGRLCLWQIHEIEGSREVDVITGEGKIILQGSPGQLLSIPFGLIQQEDGVLLVTDIGSNCVLELDSSGRILQAKGGWGWGTGQLRDPWALAQQGDGTLVLDSGNNRILLLDIKQP